MVHFDISEKKIGGKGLAKTEFSNSLRAPKMHYSENLLVADKASPRSS